MPASYVELLKCRGPGPQAAALVGSKERRTRPITDSPQTSQLLGSARDSVRLRFETGRGSKELAIAVCIVAALNALSVRFVSTT